MLPTPCDTIVHSTAGIVPYDVSSGVITPVPWNYNTLHINITQPSPSPPLPHVCIIGMTSNVLCFGHDCRLLTSGKVSLTLWTLVPERWNLTRGR